MTYFSAFNITYAIVTIINLNNKRFVHAYTAYTIAIECEWKRHEFECCFFSHFC